MLQFISTTQSTLGARLRMKTKYKKYICVSDNEPKHQVWFSCCKLCKLAIIYPGRPIQVINEGYINTVTRFKLRRPNLRNLLRDVRMTA